MEGKHFLIKSLRLQDNHLKGQKFKQTPLAGINAKTKRVSHSSFMKIYWILFMGLLLKTFKQARQPACLVISLLCAGGYWILTHSMFFRTEVKFSTEGNGHCLVVCMSFEANYVIRDVGCQRPKDLASSSCAHLPLVPAILINPD